MKRAEDSPCVKYVSRANYPYVAFHDSNVRVIRAHAYRAAASDADGWVPTSEMCHEFCNTRSGMPCQRVTQPPAQLEFKACP